MTYNWPMIGHVFVGTIITGTQAIALAFPTAETVAICHIIALMTAQVGVSLGVWQAGQQGQLVTDNAMLAKGSLPIHEPIKEEIKTMPLDVKVEHVAEVAVKAESAVKAEEPKAV